MKRLSVLLLCLALIATLSACGKQPTAEIEAARTAIDATVADGAEKFTPEELKALNDQLAAALEEIKVQDGKTFKSYDQSKNALLKVTADAEALKARIVTVKEEQQTAAATALQEATAAIDEAKAMLAVAPVGKGSLADIEMMKADVAGLEIALTEVQPLIDSEEFVAASEKATAIKEKALSVSEEIRIAQEKAAAAEVVTK
ncbi:MAG: DUF4398 domain-containing protein [Desulfuromonadales bacterium]|nr:DUF4398 domain-containing protein [Desulfuromonadales bacterium]